MNAGQKSGRLFGSRFPFQPAELMRVLRPGGALLGFFGAGGPDDLRYSKYFIKDEAHLRRELTSRAWPTGFEPVMPVHYADAAAVFSFLFRRPVAPASPRGARSFFSVFFSVSFGVSARSTSSRNTMGAPSPGRGPALMIRV